VTADEANPDAFEDSINGHALRENGGLDRMDGGTAEFPCGPICFAAQPGNSS
jgi:hypothetical protein